MAFSKTDQKRVSLLSLMDRAVQLGAETLEDAYADAAEFLPVLEEDGFFDSGNSNPRSSGRKQRSGGRGSSGRSRGRDRKGGSFEIKDPDAPATDAQVRKAIAEGAFDDGYSEDDLYDMTKGEISDIIQGLIN